MSTTGISAFDDTIHTTNVWLKELMERLGTDSRIDAYRALRVTIQTLRDRLPVESAVQLSAQMPMLVRGFYYEGWKPAKTPTKIRTEKEFLESLEEAFSFSDLERTTKEIAVEVLGLLRTKISKGEINDIISCMPPQIRALWEEAPVMEYYHDLAALVD